MKIELLYTPGCVQCSTKAVALKAAAVAAVPDVEWLEVDLLEDLDRAVDLGVLTLPALAVDGELVFAALPSPAQLIAELLTRATRVRDHES